jgi:hypothetical protein
MLRRYLCWPMMFSQASLLPWTSLWARYAIWYASLFNSHSLPYFTFVQLHLGHRFAYLWLTNSFISTGHKLHLYKWDSNLSRDEWLLHIHEAVQGSMQCSYIRQVPEATAMGENLISTEAASWHWASHSKGDTMCANLNRLYWGVQFWLDDGKEDQLKICFSIGKSCKWAVWKCRLWNCNVLTWS